MTTEVDVGVGEMVMKTVDHFRDTAFTLHHRAQGVMEEVKNLTERFNENVDTQGKAKMKDIQAQIVEAVQDMGPVEDSPTATKFLIETYSWAAICLFGFSMGQIVGGYILTYFLGWAFSTFFTVIAAYLILPGWYFFKLQKREETDELQMLLFFTALTMGILSGHNISHLYRNFTQPPAFFLPFFIGAFAAFLGPTFAHDRRIYLGAVVGGTMGVFLLFGLISQNLGLRYLIWMAATGAVTAINFQMQLANLKTGGEGGNVLLSQFCMVTSAILVDMFIRFVFGSRNKKVQASPKPAPRP